MRNPPIFPENPLDRCRFFLKDTIRELIDFSATDQNRVEWRYGLAAHKVIALDAGHVCQNLYVACQAIEAGTCATAAYDQEAMDALLGLDGEDEFTIYVAPVGKVGKVV